MQGKREGGRNAVHEAVAFFFETGGFSLEHAPRALVQSCMYVLVIGTSYHHVIWPQSDAMNMTCFDEMARIVLWNSGGGGRQREGGWRGGGLSEREEEESIATGWYYCLDGRMIVGGGIMMDRAYGL